MPMRLTNPRRPPGARQTAGTSSGRSGADGSDASLRLPAPATVLADVGVDEPVALERVHADAALPAEVADLLLEDARIEAFALAAAGTMRKSTAWPSECWLWEATWCPFLRIISLSFALRYPLTSSMRACGCCFASERRRSRSFGSKACRSPVTRSARSAEKRSWVGGERRRAGRARRCASGRAWRGAAAPRRPGPAPAPAAGEAPRRHRPRAFFEARPFPRATLASTPEGDATTGAPTAARSAGSGAMHRLTWETVGSGLACQLPYSTRGS